MRTIFLIPGFLIALLMAGCHHHDRALAVPVPPVVSGNPAPAPATSESTPVASLPAEPKTEAVTKSIVELPASIQHSLGELLLELNDAYFDLDQHDLRDDARKALSSDSSVLKAIAAQAANATIVIEGHCDERGSAEYNMALGAMRADAAKDFLTAHGIPGGMLETITYGKERPQCTEQTEECWQRNRRAHLASEP